MAMKGYAALLRLMPAEALKKLKVLIDRLTDFAESKELDDDYTLLIIRFL